WRVLDAPIDFVAKALASDVDAVVGIEASLDALGVPRAPAALHDAQGRCIVAASRAPWHERTMAHLVDAGFERYPDRSLLVVAGVGGLAGGELAEAVAAASAALRSAGIARGDRIAIDATPSAPGLVAMWAALCIGAVLVPVREDTGGDLRRRMFALARPKLF